ncbi:MAG: aminoglycoside phosphotransferase family protein [Acidimicrobiaceae bacterium]|nr:aminoglycoside phosphotransferase family protein [Acidimicrobiaceae bacterium]
MEPDGVSARLRAAGLDVATSRPIYLRYKPARSALVSLELVAGDGVTGRGYVRWSTDAAALDAVEAKAATRWSDPSMSVVRLGPHELFFPFPTDAELVRLRWYVTGRKLKRSLGDALGDTLGIGRLSGSRTSVHVLVHKPERRVVSRADLVGDDGRRVVVVRCSTAADGHRRASVARVAARHGVRTAGHLGLVDGGRVGVDEHLDGVTLDTLPPDAVASICSGELADLVARLHELPPPSTLPRRAPLDHLRSARQATSWASAWDPVLSPIAGAVADRLAAACPTAGRPVLVHGDLHDGNVVVGPAGLGLIDLDRVCVGDAEADLGRLRAAAMASDDARMALAEGAVEAVASRHGVDADRLAWYTAVGLVDRAVVTMRELAPDAIARARHLLTLAGSELVTRMTGVTGVAR